MNVELLDSILKIARKDSQDPCNRAVSPSEISNETDIPKSLLRGKLRDLVLSGYLKYVAIGSHAVTITTAGIAMTKDVTVVESPKIRSIAPEPKTGLFSSFGFRKMKA